MKQSIVDAYEQNFKPCFDKIRERMYRDDNPEFSSGDRVSDVEVSEIESDLLECGVIDVSIRIHWEKTF